MEIIRMSHDYGKPEIYRMTHNKSLNTKDLTGEILNVNGYVQYTDVNARGENVNILVLDTDTGFVSTISETFKRAFFDIADVFAFPVCITVTGGKTKSGRDYVTCELG